MRTFLYFLWIIISSSIFVESFIREKERRDIYQTIKFLHELGHKACPRDVENAMSDRFTSLPDKREEISQALNIAYNSTFELFKKNRSHCHWNNNSFQELMEHLHRQAQLNFVPVVMSSELETLVENFKKLDQFLTQQNFSCCAWETVRQDILIVMDHFRRMTRRMTRRKTG